MYLFGFVAAFNEFYVRGRLIVENNAADTARNIIAHERLFRLGIAIDLVEMASIVVLATALYVILKAVNQTPSPARGVLEADGGSDLCGYDPQQL
jgi:hypothetical protein